MKCTTFASDYYLFAQIPFKMSFDSQTDPNRFENSMK